jgi:predicted amidohydrolase
MKISLFQFSPEFGKKDKNIEKIEKVVDSSDSEIIVFPELCTTGYDFRSRPEAAEFAEEFTGDTVSRFAEKSKESGKIIIFGFAERDGLKIFNSCALLFPEPDYNNVYRKTHLFFKERFCFDENDKGFFVVDYRPLDIKIGPMICYDWRFPEATRTLALKGADLVVCPSNLVTNVWPVSIPSRALENKVYMAVANRVGTENRNGKELLFNGKSAVYSYNSEIISKAGDDTEELITAEIFPEKTRDKSFNEYNDIFTDRRPEFYL